MAPKAPNRYQNLKMFSWKVLVYNTLILLYIKLLLIPYNIYYNTNSK